MPDPSRFFQTLLCGAGILAATAALADWPHDPLVNVPLHVGAAAVGATIAVDDGAGGAIVVWEDLRNGNADLFAQRVAADGTLLWAPGGVPVCTAGLEQYAAVAVSDGAGGLIIAWQDWRGAPAAAIYLQRLDASGQPQWPADGMTACAIPAGYQSKPAIAPDGAGGVVVAWEQELVPGPGEPSTFEVHANRISAAGARIWSANGIAVCNTPYWSLAPMVCADGAGGAFFAWKDGRATNGYSVYVQRMNSAGLPMWPANGRVVSDGEAHATPFFIAPNGSGGAVLAWGEFSLSDPHRIFGAILQADGSPLPPAGGLRLCSAYSNQETPVAASDGAGGLIVAWQDDRVALGSYDLYAQRLGADSRLAWDPGGVAIGTAAGNQTAPAIVADGAGGALLAWRDQRTVSPGLYAQSLGANGAVRAAPNGVPVSTSPGNPYGVSLASDGRGGAIAAWVDQRTAGTTGVYAQSMDHFGPLGDPRPRITEVRDVPGDEGGLVQVSWSPSYLDAPPSPGVHEYRIWRSVPTAGAPAMAAALARGATSDADEAAATGRLLVGPASNAGYAWEYLGTVPATFATSYSQPAPTAADSVGGAALHTAFLVQARNTALAGRPYWFSEPDSGYSVDNLAPQPPSPFVGAYGAGQTHLAWGPNDEPDFAQYRLYRGPSAAFTPEPGNLVVARSDTGYTDVTAQQWHYKLVAVDVHGNVSAPALVSPGSPAGVGGTTAAGLALAAPSPNPARLEANVRYSLPVAGQVRLALYDLAGREVRLLAEGPLQSGEHATRIALRDDAGRALPAGVYLLRLEAAGRSLTRRMVAVR